jgi:hypothetical protein
MLSYDTGAFCLYLLLYKRTHFSRKFIHYCVSLKSEFRKAWVVVVLQRRVTVHHGCFNSVDILSFEQQLFASCDGDSSSIPLARLERGEWWYLLFAEGVPTDSIAAALPTPFMGE